MIRPYSKTRWFGILNYERLIIMLFSLNIVTNTSSQNPVIPPPLPLGQTQVECVTNLKINKFTRHPSDNWKVVVSGPDEMTQKEIIKYEASTPNKDPFNTYNWLLGNETPGPKGFVNYWNVTPLPGPFILKGDAYIPYAKLPMLNDDFGTTHGDATVIENNQTSGAIQKDVKVFFRKDDMNYNDDKLPNWFFYWSQIPLIQDLLQLDGMYLYDIKNCKFNDTPTPYKIPLYFDKNLDPGVAGSTNFPYLKLEEFKPSQCYDQSGDKKQKIIAEYSKNGDQIKIRVGQIASEISGFCKGQEPERKGIHVFYNTIAHEVEHVKLKFEIWNYTHPSKPEVFPGYNDIWDLDRDYYKDVWEEKDLVASKMFETESGTNQDRYISNYSDCFCFNKYPCSAGTQYEEERCRKVANELDYQAIDKFDWSYDLYLKYQGKQWK